MYNKKYYKKLRRKHEKNFIVIVNDDIHGSLWRRF